MKSADYDAFDRLSKEDQERVMREIEEQEVAFEQQVRQMEEMEEEQKARMDATIDTEEEEKKYLLTEEEFTSLLEVCEAASGETFWSEGIADVDTFLRNVSGIRDLLYSERLLSFVWGALLGMLESPQVNEVMIKKLFEMISEHFNKEEK